MKWLLLIFTLGIFLPERILAQGILPISPSKNINFVAISNAPIADIPSGTVTFLPIGLIPGIPDPSFVTNVLRVFISVGSTPTTDGWILQMTEGSLTPIKELSTELYNDFPVSYADFVDVDLTDSQLQSFLAGQLYAQVDFGNDGFWDNSCQFLNRQVSR